MVVRKLGSEEKKLLEELSSAVASAVEETARETGAEFYVSGPRKANWTELSSAVCYCTPSETKAIEDKSGNSVVPTLVSLVASVWSFREPKCSKLRVELEISGTSETGSPVRSVLPMSAFFDDVPAAASFAKESLRSYAEMGIVGPGSKAPEMGEADGITYPIA